MAAMIKNKRGYWAVSWYEGSPDKRRTTMLKSPGAAYALKNKMDIMWPRVKPYDRRKAK